MPIARGDERKHYTNTKRGREQGWGRRGAWRVSSADKKKPTKLERFSREEGSQRAPPFFVGGGSIN